MTRVVVALLALVVLAAPLTAEGQLAGRVYRIGTLGTSPPSPATSPPWEAFLQGLRELGYVEGRNIVIERRYSEGKPERLPDLARELVRLNVDVIVAGGATPHAAKQVTSTIPIVFTNHADPVGSGLVASLARPGGNITGLSLASSELFGKRLELLKEAVPTLIRVAVLLNPTNPNNAASLREAEVARRSLHVQLQVVEARDPSELAGAFAAATKASAGALIALGDPMFFGQRARIAELASKNRLPAMTPQREYVETGGLMAYGASLRESFRRAATYVDRILKGARPAELPVEQPTKYELFINLKTAKALGLTIPQSVLLQADEVIQ